MQYQVRCLQITKCRKQQLQLFTEAVLQGVILLYKCNADDVPSHHALAQVHTVSDSKFLCSVTFVISCRDPLPEMFIRFNLQ